MVTRKSPRGLPTLGTTVEELEENVLRLKKIAQAAADDPEATIRDRSGASASLTLALRARAKARGEEELTAARVVSSPHFRKLVDVILDALEKHPEALSDVRQVVKRLAAAE